MKKANLLLLAVLLVLTGGCGKPHTDTSDLSLPGEVSTSVTSHSHQTTTTTTTKTTTTTTTTKPTTTTTTQPTTTTTTKKPTTTTTAAPTTTTTTKPTTTLPPGDYSAYERLAAAMAQTMEHPGYSISTFQLMSDLENDGGVRQSSENYFTYRVADINDPLTDRFASCFWATDWLENIGQMEISFTQQKSTHFIHHSTGYYYTTEGAPAWATLYDGFLREVATLPPAELMEGLEELPAVTVDEEGFTDSPFYKVSVPGDQFEKLYPGLMDFGVYLCNVDPQYITSVKALDAQFYYAISFKGGIREFKLYFRINIQGSYNGQPFDQIWRIRIPDGHLGSAENREIIPVDEQGYEYVAVPFTETTDQGVFPHFSFPK